MIERLNTLGIEVDLSHVGYRTSLEAMTASSSPVISSHSDAYGVLRAKRNIKDNQIKVLTEKNGVIGVSAFSTFVKKDNSHLDGLSNHFEYISNLAGPDHIGSGFDFVIETMEDNADYGYDPDAYPLPPWNYAPDMDDISKAPNFTKGLLARGFTEKEIKNFLRENS